MLSANAAASAFKTRVLYATVPASSSRRGCIHPMSAMRSITAHDVLALMRRVEERGSPSVAIKLRQYVSNVFQYAVITLRADADPASVLRGPVLKPPTENARPLSREELKRLFRQLPTYKSRRTAIAIQLLMMLFPRTIETCRSRWEEIDLGTAEWKAPRKRSNQGACISFRFPSKRCDCCANCRRYMEIASTCCRFSIAIEHVHT
ncbi:integrase [Burkholderia aenigmatica]|uniref:Integrase n=3 Tax=Burkholderiaceae TaxID=119060 RepID=A0A6J5J263_9BURK|nr:integrase [Burkholderia aenigmatica]